MQHGRWSNTEFRTPEGMTYAQWRTSDDYRAARKKYDQKRYAERSYPYAEKAAAWDNTLEGRAKRLTICARARAKKKGIEFSLSEGWALEKLKAAACEVTGLQFVYVRGAKRKHPHSPSIDRIDNSIGYTDENCRMIAWALNAALADFGMDVYLDVAKRVIARGGAY